MERIVACFSSQAQEFQVLQAMDARMAAARLGFEIEVNFAEGNPIAEIQYLFRHIHLPAAERPLAFIVNTHVADGLERVARNAARAGIGWVLLNRPAEYVEALRGEHAELPIAAISTDHREVGRIQARQAKRLRPSGGSVLYLQGQRETVSAQARLAGFQDEGAAFDLKVVHGDWSLEGADRAVSAWLRLKTSDLFQPQLVVAQNDLMAEGARRALETHRPDWARVPFLGADGLPQGGQRLVREGRLTATVVIPPCGAPAVELLARARREQARPAAHVVLAPRSHPELDHISP
jgi:ABC-type sugar transport system substrate-binding protein